MAGALGGTGGTGLKKTLGTPWPKNIDAPPTKGAAMTFLQSVSNAMRCTPLDYALRRLYV